MAKTLCTHIAQPRLSTVLLSLSLLTYVSATYNPVTYYIMHNPGAKISLDADEDVIVKSRHQMLYPSTSAFMQISGPSMVSPGMKLKARFMSYDQPNPDDTSVCSVEALHLKSGTKDMIGGPQGYCKYSKPVGSYALGNNGSIGVVVGQRSVRNSMAFEALFSVVVDKRLNNNSCPAGWFDCNYDNYCVSNEVTCNGYNDCGNSEDEIEGCGLSRAALAGIVVGSLVLFILVVSMIILLARRRYRRRGGYIQYG